MDLPKDYLLDASNRWLLFEGCQHCMGLGLVRATPTSEETVVTCPRCAGTKGTLHRFASTRDLKDYVERISISY